jgi:tRNA A-37 threonylcarbamoyl transferase component Bud32/tetratricopeptide (TPR) repeat protein
MSEAPSAQSPPAGGEQVLERGQTIDRFVVLGLVGRGGMGAVYAAYDPELDRKVAIKLLRVRGGTEDGKARLLREAQATAKLQHPNVVVVYDVGPFGDGIFIAMEFVEGQTVGAWLEAKPRARREILDVYLAAGRGLAAAHAAGLVHRDFKPDNVMVTADGQVRVMDFGLARPAGEAAPAEPADAVPEPVREVSPSGRYLSVKLTQTGTTLGTPAYMAPEQFAATATDARTDQFSFCVALYEALYGERPFEGDSYLALMTNVTTGAVVPPNAKAHVPAWLRKIVVRGLATGPAARHASMTTLLAALQVDPTVRTRRLVLGALALAAVAGAFVASRRPAEKPVVALCGGGDERLAPAWGRARKVAVQRAFQKAGGVLAGQAWSTVSRYLDAYAKEWLAAYRDACEATHVRGEQSSEVLDLRMTCLGDRLVEARALTDELARADSKVVENAVSGVSSLGPVARCSDVRLLRTLVRPPPDEATRRRVAELTAAKAKLFASALSARCERTRALEKDLLAGARDVKYAPILAEALLAAGKVEDTCGARGDTLASFFQQSFSVALPAGHDQIAAESAAFLASTLADRERQPEAARAWHAVGSAIVARLGGAPMIEIALDNAAGYIAQDERDEAASLEAFERARQGIAKLRGAEHPYVALNMNAQGLTMLKAGEHEKALDVFRNAELVLWNVVGSDHPWVATILANEGTALNALGRPVEARAAFEMASTIWTRQAAEPARLADARAGLGLALLGEGRAADAVAPLEQALAARADKTTPAEVVGETRFALARALWSKPSEHARALALARDARADYARVGGDAADVARVDQWLRAPRVKL